MELYHSMNNQIISISLAAAATFTIFYIAYYHTRRHGADVNKDGDDGESEIKEKRKIILDWIGQTPMIELRSLSEVTGFTILAKCEYMNPFGTSKDRIALNMVLEAEKCGKLSLSPVVGTIIEGTSGNTGISLAQIARARGYKCIIVMPNDQSEEKRKILEMLGAEVIQVPPVAIQHPDHYVNVAKRKASEIPGAFFTNQFENESNWLTHFHNTGPEIVKNVRAIDEAISIFAFVMSAGTGGTITGVSRYLKSIDPSIRTVLADPQGSALYTRVKHGVLYTKEQSEREFERVRYDTVTEGIGLTRLTANIKSGLKFIDDSEKITDQEAVRMAQFILKNEGLLIGSSSAVNLAASVRFASKNKHLLKTSTKIRVDDTNQNESKQAIVTILCSPGTREFTKFYNAEYIEKNRGMVFDSDISSLLSKSL